MPTQISGSPVGANHVQHWCEHGLASVCLILVFGIMSSTFKFVPVGWISLAVPSGRGQLPRCLWAGSAAVSSSLWRFKEPPGGTFIFFIDLLTASTLISLTVICKDPFQQCFFHILCVIRGAKILSSPLTSIPACTLLKLLHNRITWGP